MFTGTILANFTNPEFQFPQFKVLQSVFFFSFLYNKLYWHFWVYFDINLKILSRKNTQKVIKQNIWDSKNWVFNELNEIFIRDFRKEKREKPQFDHDET